MAAESEIIVEYSRNFTALQVKYEEQSIRLSELMERNKELTAKLEAAQKEVERRDESLRALRAEGSRVAQYKEQAAKASIASEHMRGRIETYRKALEEKDVEHHHEMEQLRSQLHDALSRVATNSDSRLVTTARNQIVELEERCAILSGQLTEERERGSQQQLSAVATVRDLSARNIELEQRCRLLDSEVSQLRSAGRRSAEQVAEATLEKERVTMEHASLQQRLHGLSRDLATAQANANERVAALESQLAERAASAASERDDLRAQIADAQRRVSELMALRAGDADRAAAQQRGLLSRMEATRAELETDLERAAKAKQALSEDLHNLRAKLTQERAEAEESRAELRAAEARIHSLISNLNSLQAKLEASAQDEAWMRAEKERLALVQEKTSKRCDELVAALHAAEERSLEADRLAVQLNAARVELADAAALRERESLAVRQLEESHKAELRDMRRETKLIRKQCRREIEQEVKQKKMLLRTLVEKEHMLHSPLISGGGFAAPSAAVDVLDLLRAQSVAAQRFQQTITDLS